MKRKSVRAVLVGSGFLTLIMINFLTFSLPVYTYESSDRGMAEIEVPWKGRHLEAVETQFEEYKQWKNDPNLRLCRTCERRWFALNLLWDNLTHRRWSFPYMGPSSEPNRDYFTQMRKDRQQDMTKS
jgi:hypothetical protein